LILLILRSFLKVQEQINNQQKFIVSSCLIYILEDELLDQYWK